ncbi:phosphotransferase [Streptomyces sp. NPDC086519]|uniref:phosphotransferase family protein n=1 Tax=Streptomyces sp. NPDC086519 TaxID=3154863 RepID=UPI003437162B
MRERSKSGITSTPKSCRNVTRSRYRPSDSGPFNHAFARLLRLPYFDPLAKLAASLEGLDGVSAEDRTFLDERAARLAKDYDRLDFVLPFGVIHGDASIGNILRHRDGHAVLIDLDGFSLAPREWDLIQAAVFYDRYGWHAEADYAEFVHRYGFDLMNWPGYDTLADLRELMMVGLAGTPGAHKRTLRAGVRQANGHLSHGWKPEELAALLTGVAAAGRTR